MASSQTDPSEDVPEELIAVLQNSANRQLRETTNYAQQLLREHLPITDAVESRHGEELVRVEAHGAYTITINVRPDEHGEARGSVAHRVKSAHVTGGAPDKASVEQREQRAAEVFSLITEGFGGSDVVLETDLRYGTDIASSVVGAAHDRSASGIVCTPRGGSRWSELVTGDVTHNLVRSGDIPKLVLPERDESQA